jgi:hypothetical protein
MRLKYAAHCAQGGAGKMHMDRSKSQPTNEHIRVWGDIKENGRGFIDCKEKMYEGGVKQRVG